MKIQFNLNQLIADTECTGISDLAKKTGLKRSLIQDLNRKNRKTSLKNAYLLCAGLNKKPEDYITIIKESEDK